ncbi:hypothetical protein ACFY91_09525 [Streptomyces albogriseolus]|uniref:hypothetical protein n=1 Tax=Streptomyces albogriseolus TaxID=1887 RepID=UPI0036F06322
MPGYENYDLGEDGYFWRGVAPDWSALDDTSLCSRLMFWQDAGEVPDEPEAPTPEVLAAYAYDKVKVPETEIELKPAARSTVNRRTRRPTPPPATARSTRTAPSAPRTPGAARTGPRRAGSATSAPRAESRIA